MIQEHLDAEKLLWRFMPILAASKNWNDAWQHFLTFASEQPGLEHLGAIRVRETEFIVIGVLPPGKEFNKASLDAWYQRLLLGATNKPQPFRESLLIHTSDEGREYALFHWNTASLTNGTREAVISCCRYFAAQWPLFERLDQAERLLHRDDLTGLYNHRYLEASLQQEIRRAQRFQTSFCVLFIDLDNFKPINDVHGHLSGSSVLKQVATLLRDSLREVDTIFRFGGDEFVVVLLETNAHTGVLAAERLRKRLANHGFATETGAIVHVTCSVGVVACPEHGEDHETLLRAADLCMYKSKRTGKNQVSVVEAGAHAPDAAMGKAAQRRVHST